MFFTIYLTLSIILIILLLTWEINLLRAFRFLSRNSETKHAKRVVNEEKFIILIPVYKETKIVSETVDYFYSNFVKESPNIYLYFITTAKESSEVTTKDILEKKIAGLSRVFLFHSENIDGNMATQLNLALNHLKNEEDTFIAIYNADSRPDRNTFKWIEQNPNGKNAKVYQQYGDYTLNLKEIMKNENFLNKSILVSALAWQCRWSLGFEIPHALSQSSKRMGSFNPPMNYTIAHGLFVRKKTLNECSNFDERVHIEDAMLGLVLNAKGIIIHPMPIFDKAETPKEVQNLFIQKKNWYQGPFQAFDYYRLIRKQFSTLSKLKLAILTTKLFFHSIYWILTPSMIFFLILLSIILGNQYIIWGVFISLAFIVIPNLSSIYYFEKKYYFKELIFGGIPFFLLHGVAGYYSIYFRVASLVKNEKMKREKTITN